MTEFTQFEIYSRVVDGEGYKGTVLYVGSVAAAKNKDEIWLGIKWDKADRGKHDGSCSDENGVIHRYFSCPAGSGSFVKPSKISFGKSLIEALHQRYVTEDAPLIADNNKLPDAFVMTSKGNQKSIELLGEKKVRRWQQIDVVEKVSLRDENISTIGSDLYSMAGHFKEIDLQDNLFYKWIEISHLANTLPNLQSLHLHGNKFQPLTEEICSSFPRDCFVNIRLLALNSCNILSWEWVELLASLLTNIEELYLAGNQLSDLRYHDCIAERYHFKGLSKLRILDLSGCELSSWQQVLYLNLPSLQELALDSNSIGQIDNCPLNAFPSLQRLSLSANQLSSWSDIDRIASYTSIRQLRLSQIPLFSGKGASEVRPKIIARIKQLTIFNGSGISHRERTDAEKSYLRVILREIQDGNDLTTVESSHPRYKELYDIYGGDLLPLERTHNNLTLAADMVTVTFRNFSFSSGGSLEPITKKIPSSATIARLRMMVKQMFALDIKLQILSLRVYKDSPPVVLDDDQSSLQYYGAIDGAEIFINEA